jgi:hypothetical protein
VTRNYVKPYPLETLLIEMKDPGCIVGKVYDTSVYVRAAVIDPHDYGPVVAQVSYPNQGA